ncbi:hypothetical protein Tco_0175085 [Tanacetum coccineum]
MVELECVVLLEIGGGICKTVYMTGTVAVKEFGLYSLWCLRILTASFRNKSMMFKSEATRWLFFVIFILLALGTSCSSDAIVACRFALDMIDSENKNQS